MNILHPITNLNSENSANVCTIYNDAKCSRCCIWCGERVCNFLRSWRMLQNECLLTKIGVDTAKNEPPKVSMKWCFSNRSCARRARRTPGWGVCGSVQSLAVRLGEATRLHLGAAPSSQQRSWNFVVTALHAPPWILVVTSFSPEFSSFLCAVSFDTECMQKSVSVFLQCIFLGIRHPSLSRIKMRPSSRHTINHRCSDIESIEARYGMDSMTYN